MTSHLTTIGISYLIKELTLKSKLSMLMVKKLDYKFGIQLDSRDSKQLHKLTTKGQWES
jgi:hypothetical protein